MLTHLTPEAPYLHSSLAESGSLSARDEGSRQQKRRGATACTPLVVVGDGVADEAAHGPVVVVRALEEIHEEWVDVHEQRQAVDRNEVRQTSLLMKCRRAGTRLFKFRCPFCVGNPRMPFPRR